MKITKKSITHSSSHSSSCVTSVQCYLCQLHPMPRTYKLLRFSQKLSSFLGFPSHIDMLPLATTFKLLRNLNTFSSALNFLVIYLKLYIIQKRTTLNPKCHFRALREVYSVRLERTVRRWVQYQSHQLYFNVESSTSVALLQHLSAKYFLKWDYNKMKISHELSFTLYATY